MACFLQMFVFLVIMLTRISCRRVSTNATIEFDFLYSQCTNSSFSSLTSNVVGDMVKKNSNLKCLNSNGVRNGTWVSSRKDISSLITTLGSSSFTVEMWIQPQIMNYATIFAVRSEDNKYSHDCSNQIEISQSASIVNGEFVTMFQTYLCNGQAGTQGYLSSAYNKVKIYNGKPAITHMVATFTFKTNVGEFGNIYDTGCTFTINGVTSPKRGSSQSGGRLDPMVWDPKAHLMLLDPYPFSGVLSQSRVHYLAMYNRALTRDEILQNYQAALPPSPAFAFDQSLSVQQNGEVGDHSDDPAFYRRAIPNKELVALSLWVYDLDDEPISPNYNPLVGKTMTVFVTALSGGQLYYLNGTEIQFPGTRVVPYDNVTSSFAVRFRPPFNQVTSISVAPFTLRYYVVDGVTGERSPDATASISVTGVDQPPIAADTILAVAAGKLQLLQLLGTDLDSDIVGGVITELPKHGQLYHVDEHDMQGDAITSAGTVISRQKPVKVGYRYTGSDQLIDDTLSSAFVGFDDFQFTLRDAEGRASLPAVFKLNLTSALMGLGVDNPPVPENTLSAVRLNVSDEAQRNLGIKIVTLPRHGTLLDNRTAVSLGYAPLAVGDVLLSAYSPGNYAAAEVMYQGDPLYFNTPEKSLNGSVVSSGPDSFQFVVCAVDATNPQVCTATSAKVTQQVLVQNVNSATEIFFDAPPAGSKMLTVYSNGDLKESQEDTTTTLSGFRLVDSDRGVEKVLVTVKASQSGGYFRLNTKTRGLVEFNSPLCEVNKGMCSGGQDTANTMTFIATPYNAQQALNGMSYFCLATNVKDVLTISVKDGANGKCLKPQNVGSISTQCFESSVAVTIDVVERPASHSNKSDSGGLDAMTYLALGVCAVVIVGCCCFCFKYKKDGIAIRDRLDAQQTYIHSPKKVNSRLHKSSGGSPSARHANKLPGSADKHHRRSHEKRERYREEKMAALQEERSIKKQNILKLQRRVMKQQLENRDHIRQMSLEVAAQIDDTMFEMEIARARRAQNRTRAAATESLFSIPTTAGSPNRYGTPVYSSGGGPGRRTEYGPYTSPMDETQETRSAASPHLTPHHSPHRSPQRNSPHHLIPHHRSPHSDGRGRAPPSSEQYMSPATHSRRHKPMPGPLNLDPPVWTSRSSRDNTYY